MKPCSKSPNYLIRNPYSYCFRMNVPADLQKVVGKKELRYSLKTGNLTDAKYKARILAGQVQLIFQLLRKGGAILSKLSDAQIQQPVAQHIKRSLNNLEDRYYNLDDDHPVSAMISLAVLCINKFRKLPNRANARILCGEATVVPRVTAFIIGYLWRPTPKSSQGAPDG